jgi:cytochrome c
MKRFIAISFAVLALAACGGNGSNEKKDDKKGDASDLSKNPDYQKGLEVMAKTNCPTCHKVDEPLTGPPFRDIANKYAPASDSVMNYLEDKIINGGTGVWGQVPMTPHPELTKPEVAALVKYIMLLKK